MGRKKGQAALEFLMTYGWAFLVIMIMVGALAYFGILDPTRFLPDRCQFGQPLLCQEDRYTVQSATTNTVLAGLVNNYGSRIEVYGANATTDYGGVTCNTICFDGDSPADGCGGGNDEDVTVGSGSAVSWEEGTSKLLSLDCTNGADLSSGDKVKFTVSMQWYPSSSSDTFAKQAEGEIYAAVQ